jgi:hypothetical protein
LDFALCGAAAARISGSQANLDVRFDNFKVEPIVCGWGAYPIHFPGIERFLQPGEVGVPGRLEMEWRP